MIGNGAPAANGNPTVYSNALAVAFNGNTEIQGSVTVDGGPSDAPVNSVFVQSVSVQGVLRVNPAGDLNMGAFTAGPTP